MSESNMCLICGEEGRNLYKCKHCSLNMCGSCVTVWAGRSKNNDCPQCRKPTVIVDSTIPNVELLLGKNTLHGEELSLPESLVEKGVSLKYDANTDAYVFHYDESKMDGYKVYCTPLLRIKGIKHARISDFNMLLERVNKLEEHVHTTENGSSNNYYTYRYYTVDSISVKYNLLGHDNSEYITKRKQQRVFNYFRCHIDNCKHPTGFWTAKGALNHIANKHTKPRPNMEIRDMPDVMYDFYPIRTPKVILNSIPPDHTRCNWNNVGYHRTVQGD